MKFRVFRVNRFNLKIDNPHDIEISPIEFAEWFECFNGDYNQEKCTPYLFAEDEITYANEDEYTEIYYEPLAVLLNSDGKVYTEQLKHRLSKIKRITNPLLKP